MKRLICRLFGHKPWLDRDACGRCKWTNAEIRRGRRWTADEITQMRATFTAQE